MLVSTSCMRVNSYMGCGFNTGLLQGLEYKSIQVNTSCIQVLYGLNTGSIRAGYKSNTSQCRSIRVEYRPIRVEYSCIRVEYNWMRVEYRSIRVEYS